MKFAIFFCDDRFDDMNMTSAERVDLLLELIERGSFSFQDSSISSITAVELAGGSRHVAAIAA
ncbi:hypothetical protein [Magnetospirillum sp. 15-1]|uniref:hypothetical protein n=1 Tax=Magnetospirillum sp. 15-1 TaxID=1979370 RepID=UPI000BBCCEE8|nr:hypothetical protein [Magnetospirillum sp. 15-1]